MGDCAGSDVPKRIRAFNQFLPAPQQITDLAGAFARERPAFVGSPNASEHSMRLREAPAHRRLRGHRPDQPPQLLREGARHRLRSRPRHHAARPRHPHARRPAPHPEGTTDARKGSDQLNARARSCCSPGCTSTAAATTTSARCRSVTPRATPSRACPRRSAQPEQRAPRAAPRRGRWVAAVREPRVATVSVTPSPPRLAAASRPPLRDPMRGVHGSRQLQQERLRLRTKLAQERLQRLFRKGRAAGSAAARFAPHMQEDA